MPEYAKGVDKKSTPHIIRAAHGLTNYIPQVYSVYRIEIK
jgi:hypothetical protein